MIYSIPFIYNIYLQMIHNALTYSKWLAANAQN